MTHSNSEFSRALGLNLASLRFGTLRRVLEDDFTIESDGPASNALDAGGVDRTVRLPPFIEGGGAVCFISNVGTSGNLLVTSANGLDVATLEPDSSSFFIATEVEWIAHKSFQGLHVFGPAGANHSLGLVPDPGITSPGDLFLRNDGQWAQIQVTGIVDSYKFITDGTNTAVGAGPDTLRLRSDDGTIIATVTNNHPTYGDTVNFDVYEPNIDHNLLGNYVADQHVAHSLVNVNAGTGLSGGGNIASSLTINFDPHSLSFFAPALTDGVPLSDASTVFQATLSDINAILVHDNLTGFVANRHVDHSLVSIQAGTGLSGGGDITATRTLSLNINGLTVDTIATGDFLAFYDISGVDHNKITFANFNASLDHNSLLNYDANKHVDHTLVSINAGTGLTGGGTIATSRTLAVSYGTTAGTAAQGNDSRITGAMQKANNLSDVTNVGTARTNLGLGTAATQNTGVGANNVVQMTASAKYPAADGSLITNIAVPAIPGYLYGLKWTWVSNTSFQIASGSATDSANAVNIALAAAMTKTTGAWAQGTGNGSLDTGVVAANKAYAAYLIQKPSTGDVDILISLNGSSPTLPALWTVKRRVCWMMTDGSGNLRPVSQWGHWFFFVTPIVDYNSTLGTTVTSFPVQVPPNTLMKYRGYVNNATVFASVTVQPTFETVATSTWTNSPGPSFINSSANSATGGNDSVLVDSIQQIMASASAASTTFRLFNLGWMDMQETLGA